MILKEVQRLMWIKPEIIIRNFDKEDIKTLSAITLEEATNTVDVKGAEESFKQSWISAQSKYE